MGVLLLLLDIQAWELLHLLPTQVHLPEVHTCQASLPLTSRPLSLALLMEWHLHLATDNQATTDNEAYNKVIQRIRVVFGSNFSSLCTAKSP